MNAQEQVMLPGTEQFAHVLAQNERIREMREAGYVQYAELSDTAKEKAREWYLTDEPSYGWWKDDEDFKSELALAFGFKIDWKKSNWSLDDHYKGMALHGLYSYDKGWKEYFRKNWPAGTYTIYGQPDANILNVDVKALPADARHMPEFAQKMERAIMQLQAPNFYRVEMRLSVRHGGGNNFSQSLDIENFNCSYAGNVSDSVEQDAEHLVEILADGFLDMLQREYDYLTSDETAEDTIIANEYWFTPDGAIAG